MLKCNNIILEREFMIVRVVVIVGIVGSDAPRLIRLHAGQVGQRVQTASVVRGRALCEAVLSWN
jgi:hypothetical protein